MNYIARLGLMAILILCIASLPHAASAQDNAQNKAQNNAQNNGQNTVSNNVQMLPPLNCANAANVLTYDGGLTPLQCGQDLNAGNNNFSVGKSLSVGGTLSVGGITINGTQLSELTTLLTNISSLNCGSGWGVTVTNGVFSCIAPSGGGGGGGGGGGTQPSTGPTLKLNGCSSNCPWDGLNSDAAWTLSGMPGCLVTGSTATGVVYGKPYLANNWFISGGSPDGGWTVDAQYSPYGNANIYPGDWVTGSVNVTCNAQSTYPGTYTEALTWKASLPAPVLALNGCSGSFCTWDGTASSVWTLSNMNGCTVQSSADSATIEGQPVNAPGWFTGYSSSFGTLTWGGTGSGTLQLYYGDNGTASVTTSCGTSTVSWTPANPSCPAGEGPYSVDLAFNAPFSSCSQVCGPGGSGGCSNCMPGGGKCPAN